MTSLVNPVATLVVPRESLNHHECLKTFTRVNFKRWQQKILFCLTTLSLVRFLSNDPLAVEENEQDKQKLMAIDAWKHPTLDKKYKTEDAEAKKFIVGQFLDFKMVNLETIISQVQDLQVILHEIHAEGMFLSESFQTAALIEKLPNGWKNFKNFLKHKRKEMIVEELIVRLRIEEDNKKKMRSTSTMKCFNYGSDGHQEVDYHKKKKHYKKYPPQNKSRVHMAKMEDLSQDVDDMHLLAVVSELFMRNSTTSTVEGKGKVVLKMTLEKELTLNTVLFVLDICKNLVFGSLLSKHGFLMVFESDKVVQTKSGVYVGKEYMSGNIHKNIMMESRNASFYENVFPCRTRKQNQSSKKELEMILVIVIKMKK
ncbi:uncharacterized protein LOC114321429 [Camellia sinensis]|uniref:uncharacterized protein LOC114321429 n=1 Tax=Camellia sinensis TaxID=4442 RepID=UPI001035F468|nr:uncharacterized protein LOC114321429 [Camellia sinensis]